MSPPTRFPALPGVPQLLKAEMLITTPMFLGDGGQKATSIRPPSIKGALRFWWRALQWPRLYQRHSHVGTALADLHTREAALFGLAAGHKVAQNHDDQHEHQDKESGGQGRFRISVTQPEVKADPDFRPSASMQYLLGQGLYKGKLNRDPLQQDKRFTLELTAKPGGQPVTEALWQSLEEALLCWGLLGGLGARARKGLGSVSLQSLEGGQYQAPQNRTDYETLLETLLAPLQGQDGKLPPFTAFSSVSRVDIALEGKSPDKVLETLGHEMQMYRSYGRNKEVNRQPAEQNFADDHDLVLHAINTDTLKQAPRRTVFGLPHNYFFSSVKKGYELSAALGDRRASPLLLHVHQLPEGEVLGVASVMPAVFLPPDNARLKAGSRRKSEYRLTSDDIDWSVLHGYLDRFSQRQTLISPLTPNTQEAQG
ncbi:RAMP superfamily CRISPR-associated protein [Halomonas sp. GFAJ-1]|uniref:RAMP superfamily CRISPR-associated protein n=1 Tax=Halomonas sp. GFAJ-1 TaxID=1118153 RepID=UPI00023A33BF|nr:RAMP superfamily CRISPR-associated protein [Halomonas sp. GFAJ-1]AVI62970.1 hypothetical protein BB497_09835 [Halomonas sp. GFAJ-1]EHK60275.1 CRISPR-associated RAMP protein, Cmr1 family [Halomonas sp. GFAJ-1]